MMTAASRIFAVWFDGWAPRAAAAAHGIPADTPFALTQRGQIFMSGDAAAYWGVRAGQRIREAQAACPSLVLLPYDIDADYRAFERTFAVIDAVVPGGQVLKPGLCALRGRGATRYYGGEQQAAEAVLTELREAGLNGARIGIAEGIFPAEMAARRAEYEGVLNVPADRTARFVASIPLRDVPDEALAAQRPLLQRLGVHTMGDYARLTEDQVRDRFGTGAVRLHRLANGDDPRLVDPTTVSTRHEVRKAFEPPLDRVEQIAFTLRADIDALASQLAQDDKVMVSIRISLCGEDGGESERSWSHPRFFRAHDVVDRLRWQVQGEQPGGTALTSAIASVRIRAEAVDDRSNYDEGLWGDGVDARIDRSLTRVQSMVGHAGVCTLEAVGGRMLRERQRFVPWGERRTDERADDRPWPGAQTGLPPTLVFEKPFGVAVLDVEGNVAAVSERGALRAPLSALRLNGRVLPLRGWAGPWGVESRWWDPRAHRRVQRFQAIDAEGTAWLLTLESGRWTAEARYD